jgi:hypothetical protein
MQEARVARGAFVLMLGLAGCAPSLATLQPANVAPAGHFQMTAGMEVAIPTGTISRSIDTGKSLADLAVAQGMLSAEQKQQVYEAGINLLSMPPSVGPHLAAAYTVVDRLEISIRSAVSSWRFGARYQLLRHENAPFDMVIGAGVARSSRKIPVEDFIPGGILKADDFTRWSIDVPLLIGTSRSWYRVWAGPKVLHSRFDTALRLTTTADGEELATFDGSSTFVGGLGGVAVGYRNLFFGVELTVGQMFGSAALGSVPGGIDRSADLSGLVIYPAFGLMGEI